MTRRSLAATAERTLALQAPSVGRSLGDTRSGGWSSPRSASCLRYRVTGLAAEAAFFAVLSVPPLIFALAGAVGYVSEQFSPARSTRSAARSST